MPISRNEAPIERHYYSAESLRDELRTFEERYGLSSADFYKRHVNSEAPRSVTPFDRVVWSDTYREVCRLGDRALRPA
ncbi:MAG: hypothetical protein ACLPTJ_03280 [Solirubrobacteraceae bacterium]